MGKILATLLLGLMLTDGGGERGGDRWVPNSLTTYFCL
jgi:hypothetical protein